MANCWFDWEGYNTNGFTDCCFWKSVKCNLATGRVIKLDLKAGFGTGDGWIFNASLFLPFKSLQVLVLSSQNIIGWTRNEGFSKLRQLPNLKVLDLQYNPIHPKVLLSSLCWISSLEVLKLGVDVDTSFSIPTTYNSTSMKSKKCGGGLSNLRELWFEGYGIDDINILSALGRLRNLEKLNLNDNNFNSTIFSSLKIFPSLKHLNLAANEINGYIEMNDIIALSNLKHLDLSDNNIESFVTDKGSKKRSTSFRSLLLGSSNSNSSRVIQSLKSFSSLKSLSYENSDLTAPTIIYALRNLSTLEYLYLDGSSINDNFLPNIGHMTSLKVLSIAFGSNNDTIPNQGWCELKHLEELDFVNNNFEGTLPSCLGNLTSLRRLSLAGNNLRGNIASHSILRRLTSLEYLSIEDNQFDVPLSFSQFYNYTKLIYLDVGDSTIIPDTEFQNWIPNFQLEFFGIYGCIKLQKLPSFLHYQYDLRILVIDENQLQGKFPTWLLENNTRIAGVYSRDNAFDGPFKLPSIVHLYLKTIDVSNNKLNGHIPDKMSLAFPKLTSLNMSQNFLEGPIPSKISGIHLETLDLSNNLLSGEIPSDVVIGSPQLLFLRLSNNKLKGKIFLEVKSHILSFLYLNGNNLEGPLPSNTFITSLFILDASRNNFTGEIPRWITDNTRLLLLDLSKNHLTGSIPVEICKFKLIQVLAISENRLSGFIPSCVSSLPLEHIHLEKNQLGGGLEHVLFNFSSLITLDLRYNNFTGHIPHTIGSLNSLNYLLLSHNQLEGQIPIQICMLNMLSIMDLSFNKLYGPLFPCLGNLTQAKKDAKKRITYYFYKTYWNPWLTFLRWIWLERHYHNRHGILVDTLLMDAETVVQFSTKRNSYTYKGSILKYMSGIDLSSNRLTGEIPIEIGNMSNIHTLNLSHNHLIGRIPNTFSNLQEIESLDLSCNRLNGSIPVGLIELNSLAVFSVAYNNLSGAVPDFKAQFGTFNKSSYEGNPSLCGYPLDNKCGMSPKLSNISNINGDEESSELEDIQCFYIGLVVSYGAILLGLSTALCFNRYWRKAWFRMIEALMFCCYYFVLDNLVTPIKSSWFRNVG
ncbi:cuscuta receptor 1-like isoform X2 [Solanum lycopersicum]|uniref:cuscuta receptor 1-like isoform X2 n=1 Tax=Solanum lycopersicum TaxID=4081 RepID=UPI000532DE5A